MYTNGSCLLGQIILWPLPPSLLPSLSPPDTHRALELLEEYRKHLSLPENQQLYDALTKAIVAIRSRLFQALLGKASSVLSTASVGLCIGLSTYSYTLPPPYFSLSYSPVIFTTPSYNQGLKFMTVVTTHTLISTYKFLPVVLIPYFKILIQCINFYQ